MNEKILDTGINDTWIKNFRTVAIKIADGTIIKGKMNIGDYHRLSDFLKRTDDNFVTVVTTEKNGKPGKIFMINKSSIVWVAEYEDEEMLEPVSHSYFLIP
jgi:hypothetical protein